MLISIIDAYSFLAIYGIEYFCLSNGTIICQRLSYYAVGCAFVIKHIKPCVTGNHKIFDQRECFLVR